MHQSMSGWWLCLQTLVHCRVEWTQSVKQDIFCWFSCIQFISRYYPMSHNELLNFCLSDAIYTKHESFIDADSRMMKPIFTAKTRWLFKPQSGYSAWLQTNWRDSGCETFAVVLETNCTRHPKGQLPSSSYNHNALTTLTTSVNESL